MRECGSSMNLTAKAHIFGTMEVNTLAHGLMVSRMDMGNSITKMGLHIKENFSMISSMVMVCTLGKVVNSIKALG